MIRAKDWLKQAQSDFELAKIAKREKKFEWACFAAQQAVVKTVKAVFQSQHIVTWGHSVGEMLKELQAEKELCDLGDELDIHYIAPRYPNSYPSGAPTDHYTETMAERAIKAAGEIIEWCKNKVF